MEEARGARWGGGQVRRCCCFQAELMGTGAGSVVARAARRGWTGGKYGRTRGLIGVNKEKRQEGLLRP